MLLRQYPFHRSTNNIGCIYHRRSMGYGPTSYPSLKNPELLAPLVIAYPRPRRGRSAARTERRSRRCPALIIGNGLPDQMVSIDSSRITTLRDKGCWESSSVIQLDLRGEIIVVSPTKTPWDPITAYPTCVVFTRKPVDAGQLAQEQEKHFKDQGPGPQPNFPFGWRHFDKQ